jgi:hypothetical protein
MAAVCEEHGTQTRLRCATCDKPICNRCLVETRVGFKCQEHGRLATATPTPDGRTPAPQRGGGLGMGFFPIILVAFVVFPLLTVGFGALFAVTADATGFVALLPLLAVFVVLTAGTIVLGRRLTRR